MTSLDMNSEERDFVVDRVLDVKGLNCPLPVLKTKIWLNRMPPESVLRVEATDRHAPIDFEAYCVRSGHALLASEQTKDGVYIFNIRKAKRPC